MRAAWYQAVIEAGHRALAALYEAHPGMAILRLGEEIERLTAQGGWPRLDREVRAKRARASEVVNEAFPSMAR